VIRLSGLRRGASRFRFVAGGLWGLTVLAARLQAYDWPQMNGNPQHSGNNTQETLIGPSNVAGLQFLFQVTLPSVADGAPAVLQNVSTPGGPRDLLFLTTRAGHILALDARTGATVWSHQYPAGSCRINNGGTPCYTTSSPAIDPNRQFVYGYGLDGFVHKYQVGDGTEIVSGGWPEQTTLKGFDEKGSSALSIATALSGTSYLYVTNGGYPGDAGDYQGHVTAIDLSTGSQHVFNSLCSDQAVHFVHSSGSPDCPHVQSAIWARVGVVYDNVTDRIYMATGNGLYDGNSGGHEWGDTVFSLNPDGTGSAGKPLDSYTPTNYSQLDSSDADLGSTAPAILPAPGFAGRLAVQSGKDSKLRLLDLQNLSGQGTVGHLGGELQLINVPQGGGVLSAPAVWVNPADSSTWVFVADGSGISGLKLTVTAGVPSLSAQWTKSPGGFSPLVANNVVYYAGGGLRALDPTTGNPLFTDTSRIGGIHWESPVVANGVVYQTDESAHLTAYSVGPFASSLSPSFGPTAGGTLATILGAGFQSGATVAFGGAAATGVSVVSSTQIRATTPLHAAGTVDVVVTNPDTHASTLPAAFTYSPGTGFFTVAPCRIIDTRGATGPYGGPAIAANGNRAFVLAGHCGVPAGTRAISINVTVTLSSAAGDLRLYAVGAPVPPTSAINYRAGETRADNAVVALGAGGDLVVHCDQAAGAVHLIVDVDGYFH
jgi:IPT/TIG domain-containing protein/PQQ enzyme-like repeat protein